MSKNHNKAIKANKIKKASIVFLSTTLLLTGMPYSKEYIRANTEIYKPSSTYDYRIKRSDLMHVGLTGSDFERGHTAPSMVNRYAKVIPLNDENIKYEQDWLVVFNMGIHEDLYNELKDANPDLNLDDNNSITDVLNRNNLPFTSNPWFSILLSKDYKVLGDFDIYTISTHDQSNGGSYVSSFDDIAKRIPLYAENDNFFVAPKVSINPNNDTQTHIQDINKTSEMLKHYASLDVNKFNNEWTDWSSRFLENDRIQMTKYTFEPSHGEDSFELKNLAYSNNDVVQNRYNPANSAGVIGPTWGDTNRSLGHFLLNDLGYGVRFQYITNNGVHGNLRVAVKFRTKRDPMAFFKDEKWNMVRRDTQDQKLPDATFVAANYKSYDDAKVRQQVDIALPSAVLNDTDSDGLNDYYETLLGTLKDNNNTDSDDWNDKEEFSTHSKLEMPVQGLNRISNNAAKGHLIKDLVFEAGTWVPKVLDNTKSKGMSKIYGEDPAVGKLSYEINENDKTADGKLKYALGSLIKGKTAPYATVALYPTDGGQNRDLNPLAETVADKNGNFTLTLGRALKRKTDSLNKWGNDIDFKNDDSRIPQYDIWSEQNFKQIKNNRTTAKIFVTSEGSDARPAFVFPYYPTSNIELSEEMPKRSLEDRLKEALENFPKVLVDDQNNLWGDIDRIKEALRNDPVISGMLNPDSDSFTPDGFGKISIPLIEDGKGENIKVDVNLVTEEKRKLENGSIETIYDDASDFTFNLPTGQKEKDKLTETDKYVVYIKDSQNEDKVSPKEIKINGDMLHNTPIKEELGVKVNKGDKVIIEIRDAKDRLLNSFEKEVIEREESNKLINPTIIYDSNEQKFKAVFTIPDAATTENAKAILVDSNKDPITKEDNPIEGQIDADKKTVTFDLTDVSDKVNISALFTEENKKPTLSDSITVDKREIGDINFVNEPQLGNKKISINIPANIKDGDRVKLVVTSGDSNKIEKEIIYKAKEGAKTIDFDLEENEDLAANDNLKVVVNTTNGYVKESDTKTISAPIVVADPVLPNVKPLKVLDQKVIIENPENADSIEITYNGQKYTFKKTGENEWKTEDGTSENLLNNIGSDAEPLYVLNIPIDKLHQTLTTKVDNKFSIVAKNGEKATESKEYSVKKLAYKLEDENSPIDYGYVKMSFTADPNKGSLDTEKEVVYYQVATKVKENQDMLIRYLREPFGDSTPSINPKQGYTVATTNSGWDIDGKTPLVADKVINAVFVLNSVIMPEEENKAIVSNINELSEEDKENAKSALENANLNNLPVGTTYRIDGDKIKISIPNEQEQEVSISDLIKQDENITTQNDSDKYTPNELTDPNKVIVDDLTNITNEDKNKVLEKIKEANPINAKDENDPNKLPFNTTIELGKDNDSDKIIITYPDNSIDTIDINNQVKEKDPSEKLAEAKKNAKDYIDNLPYLSDSEKAKLKNQVDSAKSTGDIDNIKKAADLLNKRNYDNAKKKLEEAIANANKAKDTKDYQNADNDKKENLDNAISKGNELLDPNSNPSLKDLNDATNSINDAINNLNGEEKDRSLEESKQNAKDLIDKLPNLSKEEKQAAKDKIDSANSKEDVQKELNNARELDKHNGEVNNARKELEELIKEANNTKPLDKYTNATKENKDNFDKALGDATNTLNNPNASLEDLNKAIKDLGDTLNKLDGKTLEDNDKYNPTIPNKIEVINPDNLTKEEKDKIIKEIKDNNPNLPTDSKIEVDNKGNVTITYPDGTKDVIDAKDVVIKINEKVNKDKLKDTIDKALNIKKDDKYINASQDKKDELDKALENAKIVYNDSNSSQKDIDDATNRLNNAINNLNGVKKTIIPNNTPVINKPSLPDTGIKEFNPIIGISLLTASYLIIRRKKD